MKNVYTKSIFFIQLVSLFLVSILMAQTDVIGKVSGTWTLSGSPYKILGGDFGVEVEEGDTLTIEPGVQVQYTTGQYLHVYGCLIAIGTNHEDNYIEFMDPDAGGLFNIKFHNESKGILRNCRFNSGHVRIEHLRQEPCNIEISQNNFFKTILLLEIYGAITLEYNEFDSCDTGINIEPQCTAKDIIIRNNTITDCNIGIVSPSNPDMLVSNNLISGCDNGIRINIENHYNSITRIEKNLFIQNTYGIRCEGYRGEYEVAEIFNNTLVKNKVGIYSWYGKPVIKNNIIVDCYTDIPGSPSYGTAIYDQYSSPDATYNLFYNNELADFGGAVVPNENNIFSDPLSIGGDLFDYHLNENSPCIDAGDPNSVLDPDGTRSDIGAFYYHQGDLKNIVIRVPKDYTTIQAAINAADNGDTVLVAADTYYENINFMGKAITVKSKDGPFATIIDGIDIGTVVTFDSGEDTTSILDGFTITNGKTDGYGGGIKCESSFPKIINNIISGNTSVIGGGGISVRPGGGVIRNNIISDNHASGDGGGLELNYTEDIIVEKNIIKNNIGRAAGGMLIYGGTNIYISRNLIINNTAQYGTGGGIHCLAESGIIMNNTLDSNFSSDDHGGGGMYFNWIKEVIVKNNIITNSQHGGGIAGASVKTIYYNNIWNNSGGNYINFETGIGDISANPMFVNTGNGDYHLLGNSPCIDAGDPSSPLDPDGTRADIGVFYFDQRNVDLDPPSKPQNLTANGSNGKVLLSWTPNTEPDLSYYILYRSQTPSFTPTINDSIAKINKTESAYLDEDVSNEITYYYRISAVDTAGNESDYSNEVSAMPQLNMISGYIKGIWEKEFSPYYITGHCTVASGDSLIIEPGVEVLFMGHYTIVVRGYIKSVGSTDNPILFSRAQQIDDHLWCGFGFKDADKFSIFKYCTIEYVDQAYVTSGPFDWKGCVHAEGSKIEISRCHFRFNYGNWSTIYIGLDSYECLVSKNIIENNTNKGIHATECTDVSIVNNTVSDNIDYGIWCSQITYNALIRNNIVNNCGRGIGGHGGGTFYVAYNCLWQNEKNYDFDESRLPTFEVSLGTGDVLKDPLFIDGNPFDYHLQSSSPCIDAGDPSSPHDPDGTRADIGAFYFNQTIPDTIAPAVPQQFESFAGDSQVLLHWKPNSEKDLVGYILFRNLSMGFSPTSDDSINFINKPDTSFLDLNVQNGTTYYYRLSAVDSSNNRSGFSAETSATPKSEIKPANISLSTNMMDFGLCLIETTLELHLVIKNTGQSILKVFSISWSNAAFSASPTSGSVPVGDSLDIVITFHPGQEIIYNDTLKINSNDPDEPVAEVILQGSGTTKQKPKISVPNRSYDFGNTDVRSDKKWDLTVSNKGTATLTITNVLCNNTMFSISKTTFSLEPTQSTLISVTFIPNVIKNESGTITIYSNDEDEPAVEISVFGDGVDITPPEISSIQYNSTVRLNNSLPIDVILKDNTSIQTAVVQYQIGGQKQAQTNTLNNAEDSLFTGIIPSNAATLKGYIFKISATDLGGNSTLSDTQYVRVTFEQGQLTTGLDTSPFQNGFPRNEWHMFSIPAQLQNKSINSVFSGETELGSYGEPNWRLFRWEDTNGDGVTNDYVEYVPSDSKSNTAFTNARAFWLKANPKGSKIVIDTGAGNTTDLSNQVISLTPGWNQIGTPFAFPSQFNPAGNDIISRLYRPDGNNGYDLTQTFRPWEGYFVYLRGNKSKQLTISPWTLPSLQKKMDSEVWKIQIIAQSGSYEDRINYFGVSESALDTWDPLDWPEPPVMGDGLQLYIPHDQWNSDNGNYTSDFRSCDGEGNIWDFVVEGGTDHNINLQWYMDSNNTGGIQVRLFSYNSGQTVDMLKESELMVTRSSNKANSRFKLVSGSENFIEEQSRAFQSSIPKQFNLLPGYPNPFSGSTTLTVELPRAELVTLTIYNVLGQKVLQTDQHFESAGRYEITWDGKDFNRQWVSAGIYIVVMRSAKDMKSIKLIKL